MIPPDDVEDFLEKKSKLAREINEINLLSYEPGVSLTCFLEGATAIAWATYMPKEKFFRIADHIWECVHESVE